MIEAEKYIPHNKIRIVTAAALFDGHDAAINVMRRIIQGTGAEVIHLGHNRSVQEIVDCAIQEDAQAVAITSYQGGHNEYFKYMHDLLKERGAGHIKIFGGGGGTILPSEIADLHQYGISRIYHPDDGREMGLQGMINDMLKQCDFETVISLNGHAKHLENKNPRDIGQLITLVENHPDKTDSTIKGFQDLNTKTIPVLGITGTGGAGKSSLVDELVRRYLLEFKTQTIAIISVDPSKRKTGGALLGDRIRMNSISNPRVYMRSMATRQSNLALSKYVQESIDICRAAAYDLIIVETSGIGQSDTEITDHCNVSLYVMTPEFGAASQLEKIDMLDFADMVAINKFDKRGAQDALRDVRKQYKRNHVMFDAKDEDLPIYGTIASQFNDPGMNRLYRNVMNKIADKMELEKFRSTYPVSDNESQKIFLIPPHRNRYLAEISEENHRYGEWVNEQAVIASQLYKLRGVIDMLKEKVKK